MVGQNFHDLGYPGPLASTLQAQIQEVIRTKGEVRAETLFESAFGVGFYEYIFVPIFDSSGQVTAVAGTTRDITKRREAEDDLRASQMKTEDLVAELRSEREKLRNLFEQAPAFIATLAGPELVFEFANEDYLRLVGGREVLGKSVGEALPEVVEQGFVDLLTRVFTTGEPYVGRSMSVMLDSGNGELVQHYLDFIYQAMRDASGTITSVLVHGVDVTEQVVARQEVERLNAELEQRVEERTLQLLMANRELEGFTYSVAHDLRAPLRTIVSSSRILLEDYGSKIDEVGRHELTRQVAAAKKLATLIDDLLKLSRLSRQELQKTDVDMTALAQAVALDIAAHYTTQGCVFEIEAGMNVVADATSLSLLLLNLMENACKFSPAGKPIVVGRSVHEGTPVFWVRDQGIGFEMKYVDKVFLPFERLVVDSDFPGTGIGLANVKRIAELHGGQVWAESVPGGGSTFFFTLSS